MTVAISSVPPTTPPIRPPEYPSSPDRPRWRKRDQNGDAHAVPLTREIRLTIFTLSREDNE